MPLVRPDGSRDARIEDLTNLWLVHPVGRLLLPLAVRLGVPANAVSIAGFVLGAGAAAAFHRWSDWRFATLGLVLAIGWMIADGLDGMIARATGTASDLGRFLDGVCDHAVFVLLYVSLATSLGGAQAWTLAACAGVAHALQATIYEGERTRFHRRLKADPGVAPAAAARNLLVRLYDGVAGSLDRFAAPFDRLLATAADAGFVAESYGQGAARPMRLMALLSNNMRVAAIYLACLAHDPRLFWWFELVPLSAVALVGVWWHRRCEIALIEGQKGLRAP